ncbi:iron-containing redox enzyme family protein [Leucobacter tenebrionis]|uniref:iron-containing redox enzyme family protein n=1 Tax=Leucobacter tenebrionis TaxID=2873270 RepID=UPI001CA66580|nr:iron-containing redox enzyme family protein [Leucobacter tenebrionis]QZY51789.1 iron-containing redox enzyme family protein [Leucobacter tenebrionis]
MTLTISTISPTELSSPAHLVSRGPLSAAVLLRLSGSSGLDGTDSGDGTGGTGSASLVAAAREALERASEIRTDDDVQLALFFLYASSYGSIGRFSPDLEWDTELIEARRVLEAAFERELRERIPVPELPEPRADAVAKTLFELTGADTGPSLAKYFAKRATLAQSREFLIQRSIYTLREADPHSWAIPRLRGRPKAALVEIQSDEYGGGRPERVHAEIFATSMRAAGLDDTYAAYLDRVPAITLASQNMMSMFGLNRRLIGAIVGHLAAFEMTSSIPNKLYGDGFRRLGFGDEVTDYFDEHVEADAVHEQIAGRDLAGALAEDRPELLPDIMFGAAACLVVDGEVAGHMLDSWSRDESSLLPVGAR